MSLDEMWLEKKRRRFDHLPRLKMTREEFMALPEYSCSYPTGVTAGKRWRREDGAYSPEARALGIPTIWIIGEYKAIPGDPANCKIAWFKPVILVKMGREVA